MINNIAWGLLGSFPSVITGSSRLLIDIAMFFGLLVIVAMALNFQYGNAGIPGGRRSSPGDGHATGCRYPG